MIALLAAVASAAPYRTDHHHAEVRWVTIPTRFLRVHVPAAGEPGDAVRTGLAIAAIGDDLTLRLADAAGWIPHGPIHVVVTDEADEMTAFTVPSWGWVALSSDPGAVTLRLRGRQDWVPDALAHELAHLVSHRAAGALPPSASYGVGAAGVAEGGRAGLGVAVTIGPNVPYGWSEGVAEWLADRAGVVRWSAGRRATLRTSALEGRLLGFDAWWVSVDKDDVFDAERAYQQGYAFARWLAERSGGDPLLDVAHGASRRYPLDWARRVGQAAGEPARTAWARWTAAAYAEAAAEAARIRAEGVTEGIELEDWVGAWVDADHDLERADAWAARRPRDRVEAQQATGAFDLFPRTSPDGRWTGLTQSGWVRVWRGRPEELGQEALTARRSRVAHTTAWIAALPGASFSFVPGRDAVVVVADLDRARGRLGRGAARDTVGQLALVDLTPRPEPVRHRGGTAWIESVDLSAARERRARIHPIPGTVRGRDPAVSPDGAQLAWLASRDGTTELMVGGIDGGSARALSAFGDGTALQHPSWSPDGRSLVVSMLRTDRPDLWRVDVQTGAWTPLTGDPQDELDPVWAEDGIWFAADPGDRFDVFRLDPDTGRVDRVTRELGGAVTPWPLPGGDVLYAAHTASGLKAVRLPASERLDAPSDAFGPPPSPAEAAADLAFRAPVPDLPIRPYRPLRSLLVPAVGPVVRLDGVPGRPTPLGGAFVKLRDAVERVEAYGLGLVGEDLLGDAAVTWRGAPPELTVAAAGGVDRGPDGLRVQGGRVGGTARARLRSWASLALGPEWVAVGDADGPRLRSVRGVAAVDLGEVPQGDALGIGASATLTAAWSSPRTSLGGARAWRRAALAVATTVGLPARVGPLAEHRTRLELDATVGWTDRPVSPDERLFAGGDTPGALRIGVPAVSVPLGALPPYAIGGEALGVGEGTWVLPVAPRLGARAGPLYVQGLAVGLGAGGAGAADPGLGDVRWAGQVTAELRWAATLLDVPWDGGIRVGWGGTTAAGAAPSWAPTAPSRADGLRVGASFGIGL